MKTINNGSYEMKDNRQQKWAYLIVFLSAVSLIGCSGGNQNNPSKTEAQFLSHVDQAHFYQQQGQLKASILEAKNAIQLKHNSIKPYQIIIQNMLIAGDARMAEKTILNILGLINKNKIKATSEEFSSLKLSLATAYYKQNDLIKSIQTLEPLHFKDQKNQLEAQLLKADIAFSSNKLNDALNEYKQATLLAKNKSPLAIVGESKTYFRLNQKKTASDLIAEGLKAFPNDQNLWLWKAQMESREHDYEKSEESYIKALDGIGQYDIMTYKKYQTISELIYVLRQEGKAKEAFVYEQILAKSGPGQIKSSLGSAKAKIAQGKLDSATEDLKFVLNQSPSNPEALYLLALIDFRTGKYAEAEKLLTKLAKDKESTYETEKLLAGAKLKLQHPKEAQEILESIKGKKNNPELITLLGITSMAMGDIEQSIKFFNKALTLTPKNSPLRERFIASLIANKRYDLAISQAQAGLKIDPNNVNFKALYVNALAKANNAKEAAQLSRKWVDEKPKNSQLRETYAAVLMDQGNVSEAEKQLLKSIQLSPKNIPPYLALGKLYLKIQKYQQASTQFEKVLEIDSENILAINGLFNALSKYKDPTNAVDELEKLSTVHPNSVNIKLVLAEFYAKTGNVEKSLKFAQEIESKKIDKEKLLPIFERIYITAAKAKAKDKDIKTALSILDKGIKLYPKSLSIPINKAQLLFSEGQPDKSFEEINKLKTQFSDSPLPFESEGDLFFEQKKYEQASQAYSIARTKVDSVPRVLKQFKATALAKGDAAKVLKDFLKTNPESPTVLLALGTYYQQQNKIELAINTYHNLIAIRPNNVIALNNLAWIYIDKNDARAEKIAQKAYNLQPNSAAIADTYGWVLYKLNKVKESLPILEKAHELAPTNKDIGLHLIEVYKKLGMQTQAKTLHKTFKS
jgi:predicted Zn-dependent protease